LQGGAWVLGSAHCAAGVGASVSFGSGAAIGITELVLAPDWLPAQQVAVNDLALMRLAQAPAGITGYAIASLDALGRTVVVAGYGAAGSGAQGAVVPPGSLRFGVNQYEAVLADTPTASYGGKAVLFDLDDGSAALNRFGSTGLGAFEAMTASLDSGGPSFVLEGGVWKIAGIHTGIASELGTTFGGVGVDLQPMHHRQWIQEVTAVPGPRGPLLMLSGLAVLVAVASRERRRAR